MFQKAKRMASKKYVVRALSCPIVIRFLFFASARTTTSRTWSNQEETSSFCLIPPSSRSATKIDQDINSSINKHRHHEMYCPGLASGNAAGIASVLILSSIIVDERHCSTCKYRSITATTASSMLLFTPLDELPRRSR